MSKNITIGVLDTPVTTSDYLRRFYPWGYPDKITPGKRAAKYDVIIIPDKISCNPTMACFGGSYEPIGLPPMDHMGEIFRIGERGLDYYKKNALVVGVGDGALMLWNELGYKAVVVGEKAHVKLIRDNTELDDIWKADDLFVSEWRKGNFIGIENLWSPTLNNILRELSREIQEELQQVQESGEKTLPPMKARRI